VFQSKCPGSALTLRGRTRKDSSVSASDSNTLRKTGKPGVYVDARGHHKISYTGSDGKRHWKWLGPVGLRDAVRAREDLNVSIRRREIVVTGESRTFAQVCAEEAATRKVRKRTADGRDTSLAHHCKALARKKVGDITKRDILQVLAGATNTRTGEPLSEGTKRQVLAALMAVFEYAVDAGYRATNPCKELTKKQRPRQGKGRKRILSVDEEARLLLYCANFQWMRPVVTVARTQALRLGEVAGLDIEDVSADKLHVRRQLGKDGKLAPCKGQTQEDYEQGRGALIDLMPQTRDVLAAVIGARSSGPVFLNTLGGRRPQRDIQRAFRKAVRYASLPVTEDGNVDFHTLRHTGISRLANHPQIPLVYVRDFARHASLSTTETYVHRIESPSVTAAAAQAMEHSWNTEQGNTGNGGE
jgi:integrase